MVKFNAKDNWAIVGYWLPFVWRNVNAALGLNDYAFVDALESEAVLPGLKLGVLTTSATGR